jgi:hypothetical protein
MGKDIYLKIKRAADSCLMCGVGLEDERKHLSAIRLGGDDEVERTDYCRKCWERLEDEEFYSHWIAKREKPEERLRISKADRNRLLLAMFERLSQNSDPDEESGRAEKLFFLAHLLMRFRVFRWARTDHAGGKVCFINTQSEEECWVDQVEVDDEAALLIKQEIEEFLRKGEDIDIAF